VFVLGCCGENRGSHQRGTQIDLQLESGEYFLRPTEKKRREEHERKQKACFSRGVSTSNRL
jgi:hypothetical protein